MKCQVHCRYRLAIVLKFINSSDIEKRTIFGVGHHAENHQQIDCWGKPFFILKMALSFLVFDITAIYGTLS
jgi:hypothetical protein